MSNSEKFCLRWNDFESNISVAFRELREDKEFFDVTLVCDEDQIQAHKVILSACSPFFRSVLRRNRHEHPLLYMKGGEVNIAQEDLNTFLAVAEDLKVKGLTQNGPPAKSSENKLDQKPTPSDKIRERRDYDQAQPLSSTRHTRPPPATPQVRGQCRTADSTYSPQDDIQEIMHVKSEPVGELQSHGQNYGDNNVARVGGIVADPNNDNTSYVDEYADYDYDQAYHGESSARHAVGNEETKDVDALLASYMQKITDENLVHMWQCTECGKTSRYITNLKDHVEANHLEGLTYSCPVCQKISKSRQSLRAHMKTMHNLSSKHINYNKQ